MTYSFLSRRLFPSFLILYYQSLSLYVVIIYRTLFIIVVLVCYICHSLSMLVTYLSMSIQDHNGYKCLHFLCHPYI